jgi:fused signal recognition particle receptor
LEAALVKADIGVRTAYHLLEGVQERVKRKEMSDPDMVKTHLEKMVARILEDVEGPMRVGYGSEPFVAMVIGVNGSGKTTTIAKIAKRHKDAGRRVIMVAGDTFRAAAVEQLEIWGERIGCPVIKGKEKADPSSVVYEAMEAAITENADLVLVDTAGRLHTRDPLMEQLKKIKRTMTKKMDSAPHETLLVIDASMGQNAILQAKTFNEAIPVTGLALTKLDGTAKGGVLVGIANELKIPVRYIGIGEKAQDLKDFNAHQFAKALFAESKAI